MHMVLPDKPPAEINRTKDMLLFDAFTRISLGGGPTSHTHATTDAPRSGMEEEVRSFFHWRGGKARGFCLCRSTRRPILELKSGVLSPARVSAVRARD